MKKFIYILFILLFIPNVKAEVTDTIGPTLNSYSFATTELYNNKTVNINIDAVDDISGASYVDFDFVDLSKDYEHDINGIFAIQVNIRNGNNTYVSNRINRSTPGNYTLRSVRVYDNNNNSTCYISNSFNGTIPGCDNKVKGLNVVLKDVENTTFSELKSFSVSKNNISPNEDVTFNMTFNDNKVKYIVIAYDGLNHIQIENTNNATSISKTVNRPYLFPVSSIKPCFLIQPQSCFSPFRKREPRAIISLPQSHLHFHNLCFEESIPASSITVRCPYLLPISLFALPICFLLIISSNYK